MPIQTKYTVFKIKSSTVNKTFMVKMYTPTTLTKENKLVFLVLQVLQSYAHLTNSFWRLKFRVNFNNFCKTCVRKMSNTSLHY